MDKKTWYIYAMGNININLAHKKDQNSNIWIDVDGPRDSYTELSKLEKNIMKYHLHVESRKMVQINLFAKQK